MEQLTFADIFNKTLLSVATGSFEQLTPLVIVLNIFMSFVSGLFIFFIYKKTFQGVLYQRSFNISLVVASTVTTMIIMTISGNLVLSLGMVGALSIVRFRTPVKDSIDLVFLFWAISVGIANGVSYYNISIICSLLIAMILLFLTNKKESVHPYLLILQLEPDADENDYTNTIKNQTEKFYLKSKVLTDSQLELIAEVRLNKDNTSFVQQLQDKTSTKKISLVSYSGDYTSL